MKKIGAFILICLTILSCNNLPTKNNLKQKLDEEETINSLINNWHKNAADANFEAYFNAMSNNGVFIGTDASENWSVNEFKKFSKPYFVEGKAGDFKVIERNVYLNSESSPNLGWFDELLNTWMGICRGSGVVKKYGKEWKIEHYVLSVTIPNDAIQDVIKQTKKHDSIFIKNKLIKSIH